MAIVRGDNVFVKFNTDDGLTSFACARSVTFNMTADTIGKSTIGSGNWKEYEVVVKGWDFTVEGIVYLDEPGMLTAPTVYEMWDSMQPENIQFYFIDESGNDVEYSGNALITNVSTNGNINNTSSINITGLGTGELTRSDGLIIDNDNEFIADSDGVLITDLI
jgi:hypothetical protein